MWILGRISKIQLAIDRRLLELAPALRGLQVLTIENSAYKTTIQGYS
jgi:hypothetical protein